MGFASFENWNAFRILKFGLTQFTVSPKNDFNEPLISSIIQVSHKLFFKLSNEE